MQVAIIGAGIGGLALAHGLRQAGVGVRLFERDPSARFRKQGYRIHISPVGESALAAVLPAEVRRRVIETATHPGDLVAGFDSSLTKTFEQLYPGAGPATVSAIDRYAFRRALITGLDDVLVFGKQFTSYAEKAGRVEIHFDDGSTETADVLVGADGVRSRVRAQLVPDFEVIDSGIRCLYGKIPLTPGLQVPPDFLRGFCFIAGGDGPGAAFAPVLFRTPPEEYGDYLMAVMTGTQDQLGHPDEELLAMSAEDLWKVVAHNVTDWHPTITDLINAADPTAAFPITLRTCIQVASWETGRVTLLGDAVHPMLPSAGAGANTALWDAARLTEALAGDSLPQYETEMRTHALAAVNESLHNAQRLFGLDLTT
ncbi:NAD(P)/FAD-dependent oxidoreductase [Kribbella sp. NPDC006257]|uniref:FAD-dependent oxidoreductase n=1 Tax=Kribbella sp. NPDC006257 TaxID=3156738 RepID=UPI0033BAFEDE